MAKELLGNNEYKTLNKKNMKNLNTMDTFRSGFTIERDGKVITLTSEEMSIFRYLDQAITGRACIDLVRTSYSEDSKEYEFLSKLMNDEDICYNIENDILDNIMNDAGATIKTESITRVYNFHNGIQRKW